MWYSDNFVTQTELNFALLPRTMLAYGIEEFTLRGQGKWMNCWETVKTNVIHFIVEVAVEHGLRQPFMWQCLLCRKTAVSIIGASFRGGGGVKLFPARSPKVRG